ncbi:MAG: hypothetical protein RL072_602 [Actinomycetota bacterium]
MQLALTIALLIVALPLLHRSQPVAAEPLVGDVPKCSEGGPCTLGDKGPLGGVVFYAATTPQWWGQYMETTKVYNDIKIFIDWNRLVVFGGADAKARRIEAKYIGSGDQNTFLVSRIQSEQLFSEEFWRKIGYKFFVPSKDELDALYNYIATSKSPLSAAFDIGVGGDPYWTSSEASDTFAWYQLFNDGTQFTDANGIGQVKVNGQLVPLSGNKNLTKSNEHKGSAFPSKPFRYINVGSWAPLGAVLPPKPARPVVPAGGRTSTECSSGRSCQVGDIGPGGGVVFYDAGKTESWGRYLEAAPSACQASGKSWRFAAPGKRGTKELPQLYPTWKTAARQRVESKRLGMGRSNTALIVKQHAVIPKNFFENTAAGYADSLVCGGKDDWFLPSKDELDTLYNVLAVTGNDLTGNNSFGFTRGYYWTSSEYNNETAWTQLWIDGQQFDREKWLNGDQRKDGGFNPFHVRPIRAFG